MYVWPLFSDEYRRRVDLRYEIEQLIQILDEEAGSRPDCIAEHVDFSTVCLNKAVPTVALYSHRHR